MDQQNKFSVQSNHQSSLEEKDRPWSSLPSQNFIGIGASTSCSIRWKGVQSRHFGSSSSSLPEHSLSYSNKKPTLRLIQGTTVSDSALDLECVVVFSEPLSTYWSLITGITRAYYQSQLHGTTSCLGSTPVLWQIPSASRSKCGI